MGFTELLTLVFVFLKLDGKIQLRSWLDELIHSPVWGCSRYTTTTTAAYAADATTTAYAADAAAADATTTAYAADAAADVDAAAAYAAAFAADVDAAAAAYGAAFAAAYAAAYAADVDAAADTTLEHSRQAIAAWHRICDSTASPVADTVVDYALRQMAQVTS